MPPYRGQPSRGGGPRGPRDRDRRPQASVSPEAAEQTRALIEYLARSLVDEADKVRVRQANASQGGLVYELSVAPDDMGRVIGKQGRVANAIRTLLKANATRLGTRITLEIV